MKKIRFNWKNGRITYFWPDHPLVIAGNKPLSCVINGKENKVDNNQIASQLSEIFQANIEETQNYVDHISTILETSGVLYSNNISENISEKNLLPNNNTLSMATINITKKCNLNCLHCYANKENDKNELSVEEIKHTIFLLSKLIKHEPKLLIISGGEPTLEPKKLKAAVITAREYGLNPRLNTNGSFITDDLIKFFSSQEILIQISIDGIDAKTHAILRGDENSFYNALSAVKRLVENGCRARISFTIHSLNYHQIAEMIDLTKHLNAEQLIISSLVSIGEAKKNNLKTISHEQEFTLLYNAVKSSYENQFMTRSSLLSETIDAIRAGVRFTYCGTGCCTCCVDSNGKLYPCINMVRDDYCAGIIKNMNIEELNHLWKNSNILLKLRELNVDTMNSSCSKCAFRYFCGGYCRGETLGFGQEITAPYSRCKSWKRGLIKILDFISETPNLYYFGEQNIKSGGIHRE